MRYVLSSVRISPVRVESNQIHIPAPIARVFHKETLLTFGWIATVRNTNKGRMPQAWMSSP